MRTRAIIIVIFLLTRIVAYAQQPVDQPVASPPTQKVAVEWKNAKPSGHIQVLNGDLMKIEIVKGRGKVNNNRFEFTSSGSARIIIEINNVRDQLGPGSTIVTVKTADSPFSFFLRDVGKECPIYIPEYSLIVLEDSDNRSYDEVQLEIFSRKTKTKLQKIESEGEESFASASKRTLNQVVPTWLGLSRDFRIFNISESTSEIPSGRGNLVITPLLSSGTPLRLEETGEQAVSYSFFQGRGVGCEIDISRDLDQGVLPIRNSRMTDDDIEYYSTFFVSFEKSPLTGENVKGTNFLVADRLSRGSKLTKDQEEVLKPRLEKAYNNPEETVLYFRSEITNRGDVPRYCWIKTIQPATRSYTFDSGTGLSSYSSGRVFCASVLNGEPLVNEEIAVLLQPGEKAAFEFFLPHSPISKDRALILSSQSFDEKLVECKAYWNNKLNKAAQIHLPEKRIEDMIRAGLLHLDLITFGEEPDGTLVPAIGVFTAIGTESSPIIQFYNSMGWHDVARRSLTYFLDKQRDDGFMQNFGNYMVETGAVLWSIGEYYRYTKDKEWIEQIKPKVLKSCDYLLNWRNDNKIDSLKGRGYGMIEGKVADPEDHTRQFMLNGYAYLGISRIAEILSEIDPAQSNRLRKEADQWKQDIRETLFNVIGLSPVVPLGDGSWCPTVPPWAEIIGPRALFANEKQNYYSHGTFMVLDALTGPMYLLFCEVLDVDEPEAKMILDYHGELFYLNNAAFSQPYYSRHNWVQIKLGLIKPFLKTYYNTFSALADRETYSFWEHLFHASSHKTHEEGWFLMETRWMLYMEEGNTLKLLNTIPRQWMEDGKCIELNGVQSYFGPIDVRVDSHISKGYIEATVECNSNRKPHNVKIRLPHPNYKKPVHVTGGQYEPGSETVTVESFNGKAFVRVEF